jgi:S-methylmethionine-dependent homocysteine/selenocysteine methylase
VANHRGSLPQLGGDFFMTDGGIETTLISLGGQDLPHFAAFPLLQTADGQSVLREYFRTYAELAKRFHLGLVLESATWRASPAWGERLGYGTGALAQVNSRAVSLIEELRHDYETPETPVVISGCVGPRVDGYVADLAMCDHDAEDYHRAQVETFAGTAADLVTGMTMSYAAEAVGLVRAARRAGMPVVISFTVETDGRLPSGQSLKDAIRQVDDATSGYPAYFMINCAHPSHFEEMLGRAGPWVERIRGLRANASRRSHAEMDAAPEPDTGDPIELGREYADLKRRLGQLNVMGGCCGTNGRHIEQIVLACLPLFRPAT